MVWLAYDGQTESYCVRQSLNDCNPYQLHSNCRFQVNPGKPILTPFCSSTFPYTPYFYGSDIIHITQLTTELLKITHMVQKRWQKIKTYHMSWAFAEFVNADYELLNVPLYLHRLHKNITLCWTLPEAVKWAVKNECRLLINYHQYITGISQSDKKQGILREFWPTDGRILRTYVSRYYNLRTLFELYNADWTSQARKHGRVLKYAWLELSANHWIDIQY